MTDPQEIKDLLDGLSEPSPDEVYQETRIYDTRYIAAAAASKAYAAGGGGGGSGSIFRRVVLDVAFDTPGLVIPASGPAGILLTEVAEFEQLLNIQSDALMPMWIFEGWDGNSPRLNLCTTAGRGDLPGTPPAPFQAQSLGNADRDESIGTSSPTGAFTSAANIELESAYFTPATSIYAYVDDESGADPGATQGSGRIVLVLLDGS